MEGNMVWERLLEWKIHEFYSPSLIVGVIKSRRIKGRDTWQVWGRREGKPDGNRPRGIPRL
jgi:hypothetical protein